MPFEFDILYYLQSLRSELLDGIMLFLTLLGSRFTVWMAIGIIMLFFRKTRKCGLLMMAGMLLAVILGEGIMKNLFMRERPCHIDSLVQLLVDTPRTYSFPSGHTTHSFVSATTILLHFRRAGIAALLLAVGISFSRMYLFVHFPTDVLAGMLLGAGSALLIFYAHKRIMHIREIRRSKAEEK